MIKVSDNGKNEEMLNLTTHLTHFIYSYMNKVYSNNKKRGNVNFNDTINTFLFTVI